MPKQEIAVTTDCVIFFKENSGTEKILLIKREKDPYKDLWALPGGFLEEEEPLDVGAIRELKEETGLQVNEVRQLKAFGDPGRDPRGRTISIAFWGEVFSEEKVKGSDDAADAQWFDLKSLPDLAFDHKQIVEFAVKRYHSKKS